VLFFGYLLQSEVLSQLPFMLKSLKIENFRGFESFELKQLGRINLLVGENNCGKTSLLEAVQIFLSRANLEPLSRLMVQRSELLDNPKGHLELEVRHLFYGHDLGIFSISGTNGDLKEELTLGAREMSPTKFGELPESFDGARNSLLFHWSSEATDYQPLKAHSFEFPLSQDDSLLIHLFRVPRKMENLPSVNTQFIPAISVDVNDLFKLFEDVVLKPEEEIIYQALRTIDSKCERLYGKVTAKRFEVKLTGLKNPVPLGSLGDGMSRMLRLALGLANAKSGVLLVDEIDTGLHFTVMVDMWRMLWQIAKDLDIQIFATTHSRDCWESLAEMAESEGIQDNEIMIHRIEKGKESSVTFNPRQMAIAVEERLEVR
jgi:AAA15 family ATPase/GTPase